MKVKILIVIVLIGMMVCQIAYSTKENIGFEKNQLSLGVNGYWLLVPMGTIGYGLTPKLELKQECGIGYAYSGSEGKIWSLNLRSYLNYHLSPLQRWDSSFGIGPAIYSPSNDSTSYGITTAFTTVYHFTESFSFGLGIRYTKMLTNDKKKFSGIVTEFNFYK